MKKRIKHLLVLVSLVVAVLASRMVFAEEYYSNGFGNKDDVSFMWCGSPMTFDLEKAQEEGYFTLNFKGITRTHEGGKACSGVGSFKLDITLNKGTGGRPYNYWRGPKIKVPLDKPVYLSGYIYPESIPSDVTVALGWSVRGIHSKSGKVQQGNSSITNADISDIVKMDNGWVFFQIDVSEAVSGKWEPDTHLEWWYLHIRSGSFHGQRVVVYVDDVKISTEKVKIPGGALVKGTRKDITTGGPYCKLSLYFAGGFSYLGMGKNG